jgi:hypothetical protein
MVRRRVSVEVGLFIAFYLVFASCFHHSRKYHTLYIDKYTAKASINFVWRLERLFRSFSSRLSNWWLAETVRLDGYRFHRAVFSTLQ